MPTKASILAQLEKDILALQGYKPGNSLSAIDFGLGAIQNAFPNHQFPVGATHEFFSDCLEDTSATCGFIAGILPLLMKQDGAVIWISSTSHVFAPAFKSFGIEPDKIIFLQLRSEKERLWVTEEALRCKGLAAVVSETSEISFKDSRRFQLAIEDSNVTGFIIRQKPRNLSTASIARWRVTSVPSLSESDLPGIGFPHWKIELLKVRNGRPGTWQMQWRDGAFVSPLKTVSITRELQRKTG